jgi:hypothetical protein
MSYAMAPVNGCHEISPGEWVFAKKENPNGLVKYKACYVAKGFNQKECQPL